MRTKDGYEVTIGMWLSDTTGIYEVKSINSYDVTLQEIIFDEDNPDDYSYGDHRYLTFAEMKHLSYE